MVVVAICVHVCAGVGIVMCGTIAMSIPPTFEGHLSSESSHGDGQVVRRAGRRADGFDLLFKKLVCIRIFEYLTDYFFFVKTHIPLLLSMESVYTTADGR